MATLKKSKLDAVINHLESGGDDDLEVIANVADIDAADAETAVAYRRRAQKEIAAAKSHGGVDEVKAGVQKVETTQPVVYQLKDATGMLRDLEVVRQKGNRIILAQPVVRDIVTVLIKGEEEVVDLEELRKLGPDELRFGVKVSALLAAAELAKG